MTNTILPENWLSQFEELVFEAMQSTSQLRSEYIVQMNDAILELEGVVDATPFTGSLSEAISSRFTLIKWRHFTTNIIREIGLTDTSVEPMAWAYLDSRLTKLRALAQVLSDPEDEGELKDHLVFWYVESKSEWCQFNCRINYSAVRGNAIDPLIIAQASIGSNILQEIERLFEERDVEILTNFISEPLPNAGLLDKYLVQSAYFKASYESLSIT